MPSCKLDDVFDYVRRGPASELEERVTLGGREAWAVMNDCQDIFACSIRNSKSETEAIAGNYPEGVVVPVRCYVEPEARHGFRDWSEAEAAKYRG